MLGTSLFPGKLSYVPIVSIRGQMHLKASMTKMELSLTRPDDWHLHLRDGELLEAVVSHSSHDFGRAIIMPNLKPPITTTTAAVAYRHSIFKALPANSDFTPLMTLYLTDTTAPNEIKLARESGVVFAVKLYPAGATTNSQDGVTNLFGKCLPVLEEMVRQNMPLLVHGEVTSPEIDVFDREKVFIDTVLSPLIQKLPKLKVVMEHITTLDAVKFVESCDEGFVAATVTPQHLVFNRNSLFQGGLRPHNYCLPVLKREIHRQAIVSAVTSGSKRFFLGTDSAPHEKGKKECSCGCAGIYNAPVALSVYAKVFEEANALDKLEAFTSFNGPDFYGLPRNTSKIKLIKTPWKVPESFSFAWGDIVPMFAGETLDWSPSLEGEGGGRRRGLDIKDTEETSRGRSGRFGGGSGSSGKDKIDALGRLLTRVLRHMTSELKLDMRSDGYVKVQDLLKLNLETFANIPLRSHDIADVREAVRRDNKQRFSLLEESGELLICTNQGHTIETVETESLLKLILSPEEIPVCVHGTYRRDLESILAQGLKRMKRLHVHFSCGLPTDGEVISGMRHDVNMLIFIDVRKAMAEGMKLYISDNRVILTEGFGGMVPMKYFLKIESWPKREPIPF